MSSSALSVGGADRRPTGELGRADLLYYGNALLGRRCEIFPLSDPGPPEIRTLKYSIGLLLKLN